MSINLKNTKDVTTNGVKILAYGQAGAGKTRLIPTLPDVIAISAEGGLLSISGSSTPYVEISSIEQLTDVYMWVTSSEEAAQFNSVAIDSISEIAEVVLAHEKATTKDPRQAYGAMGDQMGRLVRQFRDLPKNIYMTAKLDRVQDEQGRLLNGPGMPGNKTAQQLPYFFDEVFALRVEKNSEGGTVRMIQTCSDDTWAAKDRSGKLEPWVDYESGLGCVIDTIGGNR